MFLPLIILLLVIFQHLAIDIIMKKLVVLLGLIVFAFDDKLIAQCTTETGGSVCATEQSYVSKGSAITVRYGWDSLKITGNTAFVLRDSINNSDYMIVQIQTHSRKNTEVWALHSNWNFTKYNYNNYTWNGYSNNEDIKYAGYKSGTTIRIYGDSCIPLTDTFYVYYRKICEYKNKSSILDAGKQEWVGEVFKDIPGNNSRFWGNTYNQSINFSMDMGRGAPVYENNCPNCSVSSNVDSFNIKFYIDTVLPRGFYRIICNTRSLINLRSTGSIGIFSTTGSYARAAVKKSVPLIVPTGSVGQPNLNNVPYSISYNGRLTYEVYKDTGEFQADINICKMDGDFTWGINKWNAYVFETKNPNFNGEAYQGWFQNDSNAFSYNWGTGKPTINQQSCGVSMGDSNFTIRFFRKQDFSPGRYKIRVRSGSGGGVQLANINGGTTYSIGGAADWQITGYDVTSAYMNFSGDTGIILYLYKINGNTSRLSYVSCREPKNPGNITATRDTACVGGQVTLTVDTADGTETQWFKKACGGTGLYVGSGASITVTMDTSTTFYVRNRNFAVAGSDTLNKLDMYSLSCSSKRIIVVAVPSAPTAPTAQNACDNQAHVFTFNSVNAGSGGNQIQWALNSSFSPYHQQGSGGSIIDTVGLGKKDTIWVRSRSSSGGCVSSSITTFAKNWYRPLGIILPDPSVSCADTAYAFHFDTIHVGGYGNHIVWSLDSLLIDSHTLGSTAINVNINGAAGAMDTIWWWSVSDTTGCRSNVTYSSGGWVNCLPTQVVEFSKFNNLATLQVIDVLKFRVINYVRSLKDSADFKYHILDTSGRTELISWEPVKYAPDGSYYLDNLSGLPTGVLYRLEFAIDNRNRFWYKIKMN